MKEQAIQWNNDGVTHFLKAEWDQAAECFNKAREADAENPAIWNNLGLLAQQRKAYSQAVGFFQKANEIEVKPTYLVNEGNALAMQGNYTEAQFRYEKALEIDTDSEQALLSIAKLHTHLNQFQQSAFYLEKLVRKYQKPTHYYELALVYLQLGKIFEALQMLYPLAQKHPSAFIWFQIGRAEFLSKNHGTAEKYFKLALAENPDDKSFRHYLALNYVTMGNVAEGLRQLDMVLKLYPEDYEILTEKGVVLCGIHDFQEAIKCFSKALDIMPDFSKAIHYRDLVLKNNQENH